jgi:chromosome segregation ATPase
VEEGLTGKLDALKSELREKEENLKSRDGELHALREQLAEIGSVKERTETLLEEELRAKDEALRAKDSAVKDLEERLRARIQALESELEEKAESLKSCDGELEALRRQLAEIGSTNGRPERIELPQATDPETHKQAEEGLTGKVHALEHELQEKQKLLKTRDTQIEKLASELKEKRYMLAREEMTIYRSIGKRNQWKRRLAKLGLPIKPN